MEEKSLRLYSDKKIFTKITNTITKLLTPTKIGINGMLISVKRNNVLKAFEQYIESEDEEDKIKKEEIEKKYEDTFSLYLESIDKHMMDNVYKKVKSGIASGFEKEALSQYYMVTHLKDTEYLEYKYKKQIFLIQLDYETVKQLNKEKIINKYQNFYCSRMENLYKRLLKNYSIKLSENISDSEKNTVYNKILETLEGYITEVLVLKMQKDPNNKLYSEILDDYKNFERYTAGKLDTQDIIEKNIILLSISRKLFTHSLPLIVAEQCYEKLLVDTRTLIMDTKIVRKQEKAYCLLINLIEEYNLKLLSTKIYWSNPTEREEYKKFWDKYTEISKIKGKNYLEYSKQKEILFLRKELKFAYSNKNRYWRIIGFYKNKLVEFGVMKNIHCNIVSEGNYIKTTKKKVNKKSKVKVEK